MLLLPLPFLLVLLASIAPVWGWARGIGFWVEWGDLLRLLVAQSICPFRRVHGRKLMMG